MRRVDLGMVYTRINFETSERFEVFVEVLKGA